MIAVLAVIHDKDDAKRIGRGLLEKRLIAGYNLWPVESAFWWKDELMEMNETMMLMKTTVNWFDDIVDYIAVELRYEVPEVLAMDVEKLDPDYQKWVNDGVK